MFDRYDSARDPNAAQALSSPEAREECRKKRGEWTSTGRSRGRVAAACCGIVRHLRLSVPYLLVVAHASSSSRRRVVCGRKKEGLRKTSSATLHFRLRGHNTTSDERGGWRGTRGRQAEGVWRANDSCGTRRRADSPSPRAASPEIVAVCGSALLVIASKGDAVGDGCA